MNYRTLIRVLIIAEHYLWSILPVLKRVTIILAPLSTLHPSIIRLIVADFTMFSLASAAGPLTTLDPGPSRHPEIWYLSVQQVNSIALLHHMLLVPSIIGESSHQDACDLSLQNKLSPQHHRASLDVSRLQGRHNTASSTLSPPDTGFTFTAREPGTKDGIRLALIGTHWARQLSTEGQRYRHSLQSAKRRMPAHQADVLNGSHFQAQKAARRFQSHAK